MLFELETDERYEYWGGEKTMMTPGSMEHEYVSSNLTRIVGWFVRQNKLGRVFGSNFPLYLHGELTNKEFRLADLTFVSTDRLDIVQSKGIYGAPDLLIEIISPGKQNTYRDRVEKYRLYEQFGVAEYWIVQPYEEEVEIYSLEHGVYARVPESRILPGIELVREEIFE